MDHFKSLQKSVVTLLWLFLALTGALPLALWLAGRYFEVPFVPLAIGAIAVGIVMSILCANLLARRILEPLKNLRQAILHVSRDTSSEPAPSLEKIGLGREMVSTLALQIYDMASKVHEPVVEAAALTPQISPEAGVIGGLKMLNATPLPVFTIDSTAALHYINDTALNYLGIDSSKRDSLIGKNINDILNLNFPSELTYETWLADCQKNVIKAGNTWTRVRLVDGEGNLSKQFDMAASYSKGAGDVESVIVLFDHTETYAADDQEISFVAMAVHELRTPLTIMRGYIEVFEDELGPTLQPELKDFMHKMNASAQQLTAFVSNILNVARVEENQLVLTLHKENLGQIMEKAVSDLELRARVHGKHINVQVAPNIPAVAADPISVHEVINNLVDNAIKYGGQTDSIDILVQMGRDGMVETSVRDYGVGIPAAVIPKLFDKFYRSHRSRVQIGGTGLGLYLSKAIVSAHGGNIWVNSKEGEGSIFTFTLEPYDEARHGAEAHGQDGIMRGAHGWIKNHSMYRR